MQSEHHLYGIRGTVHSPLGDVADNGAFASTTSDTVHDDRHGGEAPLPIFSIGESMCYSITNDVASVDTFIFVDVDSGTFSTLQSGGADISIAATKVIIISPAPEYLKIHLGGAAAQARIFTFVWK